jgi:hypothetical protein
MTIELDGMVERSYRCFRLQEAAKRDVTSLQNWLDGTGCISRDETAFLDKEGDLASLASPPDEAIASFEPLIEQIVMRLCKLFKKVSIQPGNATQCGSSTL